MSSTIGLGKPLKSLSSCVLISAISQLFSGSLLSYINHVSFVLNSSCPLNCNCTKNDPILYGLIHICIFKWSMIYSYEIVSHWRYLCWELRQSVVQIILGPGQFTYSVTTLLMHFELLQSGSKTTILCVDHSKPENYKKYNQSSITLVWIVFTHIHWLAAAVWEQHGEFIFITTIVDCVMKHGLG